MKKGLILIAIVVVVVVVVVASWAPLGLPLCSQLQKRAASYHEKPLAGLSSKSGLTL